LDELVKRRFDGLMILERISGTKVALTIDCYFDLASNRLVEGITMRQICIKILLGVGFLLVIHEISHTASQPTDSMTRGKYIVDHVAMCVECHTPRNDKGEILSGQYLKGAPIPLNPPPYPNIKWASWLYQAARNPIIDRRNHIRRAHSEPSYAAIQTYAFRRGSSCRLLKVSPMNRVQI